MVVIAVDIVIGNTNILAVDGIDSVGIWRMPGRKDRRPVEVEVKDGYARNYLIPRKLATPWTKGGAAEVEAIRKARKAREFANLEDARAMRDALQAKSVTVAAKTGKGGRLFGSITTADIADAAEAAGNKIDRRKVQITDAIKTIGSHVVTVRLHPEVDAKLKVIVVSA